MKYKKQITVLFELVDINDAREFHLKLGNQLDKIPPECGVLIDLYTDGDTNDSLRLRYERLETDEEEAEREATKMKAKQQKMLEFEQRIEYASEELAKLKSLVEQRNNIYAATKIVDVQYANFPSFNKMG